MMPQHDSIALLPLDNRPVSYLLPKQIADFSCIDLILPKRDKLGDLNKGMDFEYINHWCRDVACNVSTWIVALDTWIYGGLIQSRKHNFTLDELKKRVDASMVGWVPEPSLHDIYGFSSIMRIPNYNSSEEEKDYWKDYGKKIFQWSELMYKVGHGIKVEDISTDNLIEAWYKSSNEIPPDILADYKAHRNKNLAINYLWLESLHKNLFKHLIFSSDDSSNYGMNVVEAEFLIREIQQHNFSKKARVLSGTDEIPLLLMTKSVEMLHATSLPNVHIYFDNDQGKNVRGQYESSSLLSIVKNQVSWLDLKEKNIQDANIIICIHVASSIQGDHVFRQEPTSTEDNAKKIVKYIEDINKPFILIDLAYANGADPNLIHELLKSKINWDNCYGYAGWNTASNSTGSALAMGICRWIAEKKNTFKEHEFKKALLVRFLDDFAYQANIRHRGVTEEEINNKMKGFVKQFVNLIALHATPLQDVQCRLPWERSFEVEINVI